MKERLEILPVPEKAREQMKGDVRLIKDPWELEEEEEEA